MRVFAVFLFIHLFSIYRAHTQGSLDSVYVLPDSATAFTIESFYSAILQSHPVVRQAQLLPENARMEVRLARGAFDPKIETRFNSKEFDNKEYYNKWMASFTVPTWFPLDPKVGIEQNKGLFIDPENSVPAADNNQQIFTGISLPLGRGLFMDDRRATLTQAKLFTKMAEAEQIKLVNKILLEAAKDYWQWYYHYYNYRLLSQSTRIAEEIFRRVQLNASLGEASGMDTVQAKITLQQRRVEKQESYLEFTLSGIRLSNYVWSADGSPVSLSSNAAPTLVRNDGNILSIQTLEELTALAKDNHPELVKLRVKLNQLVIERKLATEYLKPRLDVSYTFLNQPFRPTGDFQSFTFGDNYKFGLDFSMPVLIRKERAKLAQTKLKIKSMGYEQDQLQREIVNQIVMVYQQLVNTSQILDQQRAMANNYQQLLKAELLNFDNGESDLFKINVQQEKLIQSQSKLLKLMADYEKLKATLYWSAGVRNLQNE